MNSVEVLEDHEDHVVEESDDFVQSHVDSFFPLSEEVIEEDVKEEKDRLDLENISKQFNPIYQNHASGGLGDSEAFPVDTVDVYQPQIVTDNSDGGLDVETKSERRGVTRYAWAEITLTAFDTAGIDYVVVKNKDNGKSVKLLLDDAVDENDGTYTFATDLDIQFWNDYKADGWDLKVNIVDVNGNEFEKETHIQSQFGNFLDVIGLGWIGEAMSQAWEAAS
ncbi:MAG: hypothetical protein ACQESD_06915, partial [Thermoplasmatota archaeon]